MNQTTPKSATTAGLLGIFLGAFGAHSWYLGDKKNGIIHVSLTGGGFVLVILAGIIPFMATSLFTLFTLPVILSGLGSIVISGSGIWGFVEGIIILTKGDAGLAMRGIPVANPVMNQPYGQQPYQGYGQPYVQPQQYPQQPQYVQPMQGQPMPNSQVEQQPIQSAQDVQPNQASGQNVQPTSMPNDNNGGQVNAA